MKIIEGKLRVAASDVANFLACQELTQLDLRAARHMLRPPHPRDLGFEDLVRRGEEHERGVLGRFRADGREVADLSGAGDPAGATAEAIQGGTGVIYQGTLTGAGGEVALFGRPDFLVRADLLPVPDGEPRPDGRHYEVVDAKLARTAKARAVLQTAFYSRLLAELQGTEPRWMHLALGNGEFFPFKVKDFAAYERQTRRRLEEVFGAGPPADLYPEPVEHCAICRWSELCAGRRRQDDDLSLVAGMTTGQRRALKVAGIATRRGFAGRAEPPRLDRVSRDALRRAQGQARLQVASEDDGVIRYEILEPERDGDGALVANRGLLALPEPVTGDLFFDIEGARYYSEDSREFGLQYLFGIVDTADLDGAGAPAVHGVLGVRPGGREARVRGAGRLHHRAPRGVPGAARVPLQPLRADVGRPSHRAARHAPGGGGRSDGAVRHPRGRGGRPVPARGVRRPVPGGPAGRAGRGGELLDQAAGAAVRVRAAGGPAGGDGQPDRVRGGAGGRDGGRRRRAATGRGRVQRGRLPGHAGAAGLAGGPAARSGRTDRRTAAATVRR